MSQPQPPEPLPPANNQAAAAPPPVRSAPVRGEILLLAACFALLAGIVEGLVSWSRAILPQAFGWHNHLLPEILWAAPLVDLVLFLAIGLILMAVSRFLPRRVRPDLVACLIFGFLVLAGPLFILPELHWASVLLLSLGLAVQAARYAWSRPPATAPTLRRTFLRLLGASLALNLVGRVFGPHPQPAPRPVARGAAVGLSELLALSLPRRGLVAPLLLRRQSSAPNVLLIVLDTLRADHCSAYGYARPTTPHLERFAAEGALFEHAIAPASWTIPSHASIFTGLPVHQHKTWRNPMPSDEPTLAEYLTEREYATFGAMANTHNVGRRTALGRGFQAYEDLFTNVPDAVMNTSYGAMLLQQLPRLGYWDFLGRKSAATINQAFLTWLAGNRNGRFFAFLNYFDVHDPYIPPSPFDRLFSTNTDFGTRLNHKTFEIKSFMARETLTDQERQWEIDAYDGCLAYLDSQLGELFATLGAQGVLDETLVLVTSDHGESFDEHDLYGHGDLLYREVLHVPLIVRHPATVPAGRRVRCAVGLTAIPATVAELAGVRDGSPFPGEPLSHHWTDDAPGAVCEDALVLSEDMDDTSSTIKSVSSAQWHFIVNRKRKNELFRIDQDPLETEDLAASIEGSRIREQFGPRMQELMTPAEWRRFRSFAQYHR